MKSVKYSLIVVLMWLISVTGMGQNSINIVQLEKSESIVEVFPKSNALQKNSTRELKVKTFGRYSLDKLEVVGGELVKKNDSIYALTVQSGPKLLLTAYVKAYGSTESEIGLVREYKVVTDPIPVVALDGVGADSVTSRMAFIAMGNVQALDYKNKLKYPVVSFSMSCNGVKYSTKGNRLTKEMKTPVYENKKGGGSVFFSDVKCLSKDRDTLLLDPIRVYIRKAGVVGFGM